MEKPYFYKEEVNTSLTVLRKRDTLVTAVHNHWMFEEPRAMYMHFESIKDPIKFDKKVSEAL